MSILVIAEKPSVARDIAKVLGCRKKDDGFLHGENYIVSWAVGHLVGLCEPEEYDEKYKKWRIETLPIIPSTMKLKTFPKTKSQFNILMRLMNSKDTTEIVCATDSGREGELIFRYIYAKAGCGKPFKRLWISSMTDTAIRKGFADLKSGSEYDCLYESARCRSEADWLVGMNASRAYTVNYGVLLSIGRVQTPTLSLIVANKKEIEKFVPEKYWEVAAIFGQHGYKGTWFDEKNNETKIPTAENAKEIAARISGKTGVVTDVKTEDKKVIPPLLFDLTELQRECNRRFGLSAKKTLDTAQSLYEKHKLITYPRTDSRYLSNDMAAGIKKVLESFRGELGELAAYPLGLPSLTITKRIADDSKVTDHHAIIPTGKSVAAISEIEGKVYDLIARRLIAAFYPDYRYASTKVVTVCEGENFLSRGIKVADLGWTKVLGRDATKDNEREDELPQLETGDKNAVTDVKVMEKTTKPPKPYTEATLLSAMENAGRFVEDEELKEKLKESGLGTPATRAAIIERLISVGYVNRVKKALIATEKGEKLIEIVPFELKSPETTAKWERALSLISKGGMETEKFSKSIEKYVRYIVSESKKIDRSVVFEEEVKRSLSRGSKSHDGGARQTGKKVMGKCPLCGKSVYENTKAFYCEGWRTGCLFKIWKNTLEKSDISLTEKMVEKLLGEGKVEKIPVFLNSTKERGVCTVRLEKEQPGYLAISDFTRS